MQNAALATASSAKPPTLISAATASPALMCCTFSPTSSTVPVTPAPGTNGGCALSWYLPWMISTSGKLTSAPATLIRTSPMPIFGDGTSSTTSFSGRPSPLQTTAFLVESPGNLIIDGYV